MKRQVGNGPWFSCFAVLWLAAGGFANAATFPDLYTVTVVANLEAEDQRTDAIERGMLLLLERITGRRGAGSSVELAPLVAAADRYLTSYEGRGQEGVRVGFNANAVAAAVTAQNWPLWGAERPLSLLWVAVDFGDGRRAVLSAAENDDSVDASTQEALADIKDEMLRVADERGLPVVLPLFDVEDRQAINFSEVWGGFDPQIQRASVRYAADAQVVARVSVSNLGTDVRWTLMQSGRRQQFNSRTVSDGVAWLADRFAAEFSTAGGSRATQIQVLNVNSLADYGRVMSYLETVSVLQSIDVEDLSGNVLTLRVAARGDDQVLQRVLTLGGVLERTSPSSLQPVLGGPLVFRTVGSSNFR